MSGSDALPETSWSLVRLAAAGEPGERRDALDRLIEPYLPVMRQALLVRGVPAHEVDDVVQDFLVKKVLSGRLLDHADPSKGRFRHLVKSALWNHYLDAYRSKQAGRRSPDGGLVSLDAVPTASDQLPRWDEFDRAWAVRVVDLAVERFRSECEGEARPELWRIFEARVLARAYGDRPVLSYADLVPELRLKSPAEASNLLVTAKRKFGRALKAVVADYADAGSDEELSDLRAMLAATALGES